VSPGFRGMACPLAALVRTARSRRGILPPTHLARQGRMTVTIGRRELLAALGGALAAWPLAARGGISYFLRGATAISFVIRLR
jgi:hypothetical protein